MRSFWIVLLIVYLGGYAAFRQTFAEVWAKDQAMYVMFPAGPVGLTLYYLWRPLSYADQKLTGTGTHIGPHQ